jgi:cysteine desulfurase
MQPGVGLVSAMLAQNETGAMLPVAEIATAAHAVGAIVHTDAAQAVGKVPVNVNDLGVDLLSIAGHKMYAPKGVGALYVRRGTRLEPFARGAGQEFGLRPGTENVAFAVALGTASKIADTLLAAEPARTRGLRERFWMDLHVAIPEAHSLTPRDSLPNTLLVAFPGLIGANLLDRATGIAASTGSACHAGTHTPSATLAAMGVEPAVALSAVRLSLGRSTTEADVSAAVGLLVRAHGEGLRD